MMIKTNSNPKSQISTTNVCSTLAVVFTTLFYTGISHAQGLESLTTLVTNISAWLTATSVAVVTIAIMWCGYIMLFSRGNTSQIPYILGGGVIIGGAAQIAGFIIGA